MIIGFAGPKRSGKDYAYSIIKDRFPSVEVERVAFADPIKQKVCEIFDISLIELEMLKTKTDLQITDDEQSYGSFTGRDLIVNIGTLMRNCDEHQFEDYVKDIVEANPNKLYICTDVRYQSEVNLIHSHLGGVVVQVHREGVEYEGTETESGIDGYDYTIENDSKYEENLVALVGKILLDSLNKLNKELREL